MGEILTAGEIGRLKAATSVTGATDRVPIYQSGVLNYATPDQIALGQDAVVGPASATDNAVALFDGTTGELVKNSVVIVSSGAVTGVTTLSASTSVTTPTSVTTAFLASTTSASITNNGIQTINSTAAVVLALATPVVGCFKWIRSGVTATSVHLVHTTSATIGATTAATLSFAGPDDYAILRGETTAKWGIYAKSTGVTTT